MVEFKVGDRVIVKSGRLCGKPGKIISITHECHCLIEFDEYMDGHSGEGRGKYGFCYWVAKVDIKKLHKNIITCW